MKVKYKIEIIHFIKVLIVYKGLGEHLSKPEKQNNNEYMIIKKGKNLSIMKSSCSAKALILRVS